MLPKSLPQVVYPKLAGCALALIPAVIYFCVGAAFAPNVLGDMLEDWPCNPTPWLFFLSLTIFFIHLTSYLSLWLKWGALAAAAGVCILGGFCLGTCAFGMADMDEEAFLVLLAFVMAVLCIAMHVHGGHRLYDLAAQ